MSTLVLALLTGIGLYLLGNESERSGGEPDGLKHVASGGLISALAVAVWNVQFYTTEERWVVILTSALLALMAVIQFIFIREPPLPRSNINPRTGREDQGATD